MLRGDFSENSCLPLLEIRFPSALLGFLECPATEIRKVELSQLAGGGAVPGAVRALPANELQLFLGCARFCLAVLFVFCWFFFLLLLFGSF